MAKLLDRETKDLYKLVVSRRQISIHKFWLLFCHISSNVKSFILLLHAFYTVTVPLLDVISQPLQILVSDGLHNSSVLLEIRVTDINDRNPEFNSSLQYTADVPEVSSKIFNILNEL